MKALVLVMRASRSAFHGRGRRIALPAVLVLLCAGTIMPGWVADASEACTDGSESGGDWPMYGHDLSGTRNQTAEDVVGPDNAGSLAPIWIVPGLSGRSTPVVAGRCVYVADDGAGKLTALNIETGAIVWQVGPIAPSYPDKTQTAALSIVGNIVYANASEADGSQTEGAAPVAIARNADTGALIYESAPIGFGEPTTAFAGAVVANGLQLVVTNGGDGVPDARPGYGIVDATTGAVLHAQTTLPLRDIEEGYAGGGQWATPAVDPISRYAFNGTSNPYSKQIEHRYDNAFIKIDMDPSRPTFGQIVDAYKGDVDQFIPGLDRQPLCDMFGDDIGYHPCCNFSVTCVQLDVDFGASPTMWRNRHGELMLGDLQKSGTFHAVYAHTMQLAWKATLGTLNTLTVTGGNASSPANDGERIYVEANPGILYALDVETGRIEWVAPIGDLASFHPLSIANGVVYVIANYNMLLAYDAADGSLLFAHHMSSAAGTSCAALGAGGIAIAHHTVFSNCDGNLLAYQVTS